MWWIRYVDAQGRYRREKAGTWGNADKLLTKRKNEALQGKKLPETLRCAPVTFREIATALAWSDAHKRSKRIPHKVEHNERTRILAVEEEKKLRPVILESFLSGCLSSR